MIGTIFVQEGHQFRHLAFLSFFNLTTLPMAHNFLKRSKKNFSYSISLLFIILGLDFSQMNYSYFFPSLVGIYAYLVFYLPSESSYGQKLTYFYIHKLSIHKNARVKLPLLPFKNLMHGGFDKTYLQSGYPDDHIQGRFFGSKRSQRRR